MAHRLQGRRRLDHDRSPHHGHERGDLIPHGPFASRLLEVAARYGADLPPELFVEIARLVSGEQPMLTTADTWVDAEHPHVPPSELPERYERVGVLGGGGMGVVLKARDRVLGRTVAMKICRNELTAAARARFTTEARVTSQLEHPGIVPVYDVGLLPTGEAYYTMPVIRGRTLAAVLKTLHAGPIALRRVLVILHGVCEAMGYAHARGIIHRDLKPDNVMVGEHGETLVVDWGLAKVLGESEPAPPEPDPQRSEPRETLAGTIVGTPGYMAPEQARGQLERVDQRSDVHALGAILFEALTGQAPWTGETREQVVQGLLEGPAPQATGPDELVEICHRALAREPADRYPDARALARALRGWLDGELRREQALTHMAHAERLLVELSRRRAEAEALDQQAGEALRDVPEWADEEHKRPGWRLLDRARLLRREADLLEVERLQALRDALNRDPELGEAHVQLARHYRREHAVAERQGEISRAGQLEVLLRAHDRGEHASYLEGLGAVSLATDPPGAPVTAFPVEESDRRLVLGRGFPLGRTPLLQVALPAGSWVLRITHPDRVEVDYPVKLGRLEHWDASEPVALPRAEALGPHDRFVPPGWFVTGGDPGAVFPAPATRRWLHGLIVREHPVTNREFLAFLDDSGASVQVPPAYARGADGRWFLTPDADGDRWDEHWPVVMVSHATATAFAAWEAERTGQPWRLPTELEWEKAARGVDGRIFPWGNEHDPSWCVMRSSHGPRPPTPRPVTEPTADVSVYGVRGMAGNVADLCESDEPEPTVHPIRGGAFGFGARASRCASRMQLRIGRFDDATGFRLVRSWP